MYYLFVSLRNYVVDVYTFIIFLTSTIGQSQCQPSRKVISHLEVGIQAATCQYEAMLTRVQNLVVCLYQSFKASCSKNEIHKISQFSATVYNNKAQ